LDFRYNQSQYRSRCLHQTSTVVYCAIDSLISQRSKVQPGFEEFSVALDHANVPAVWVSTRTRLQMDDPRRKLGHNHPFIAEGGSGVYLPEDYFHLRPATTVRLGRFTCIPIAEPQPAASEALDALSEETGVPVVSLRSLSPRELTQNSGLPAREAEFARQRDFDELFFFAGASEEGIRSFVDKARDRKLKLRQYGVLWSLAVGASTSHCVRELSKLYDRALHSHASILGIATSASSDSPIADELLAACDRGLLLTQEKVDDSAPAAQPRASKIRDVPLSAAPDAWARVLASIIAKS
jgi:mannosyl-3-phosphoglycerate phosphatase